MFFNSGIVNTVFCLIFCEDWSLVIIHAIVSAARLVSALLLGCLLTLLLVNLWLQAVVRIVRCSTASFTKSLNIDPARLSLWKVAGPFIPFFVFRSSA